MCYVALGPTHFHNYGSTSLSLRRLLRQRETPFKCHVYFCVTTHAGHALSTSSLGHQHTSSFTKIGRNTTGPPRIIWEERVAVPLVTAKRPKFTPKLSLCLRRSPPPSNTPILTDSTHHHKRHPDAISRFARIHFPGRLTDWKTDRPTDWIGDSVPRALTRAAWWEGVGAERTT